jgi:hypothetical protein
MYEAEKVDILSPSSVSRDVSFDRRVVLFPASLLRALRHLSAHKAETRFVFNYFQFTGFYSKFPELAFNRWGAV